MAGYSWTVHQYVHKNDGSGAVSHYSNSGTASVPQGSGYSVNVTIRANPYTRDGYDFLGYARGSDGGSPAYQPGEGYTVSFSAGTGNKSLNWYCKWRLKTYAVTYNANGGTGAPGSQTKTHGVTLTLSSTVPTRANYIFQGWATSSTGAVAYQPGGSYTANAAVTLYAIWKVAAGILTSVSNTEVGSSGTASWTKISESHSYKLVLSMVGADSVTVDSIPAGTSSTAFTIPNAWISALPNSATATATAVLYSYNGETLVGSTQKQFTVTVPATIKPTISAFTAVPHSANPTADGWGDAVQGYSFLTLSVTATPGTGATVSNIVFQGHGISQSSQSTTGNTAVLTSTGAQTYTVTVTDSRGRSSSTTLTVTVYEYANPSISSLTTVRCLSDGTQSDTEGDRIKVLPVFVFSSVNSHNVLTVNKVEYKAHDSSSWLDGPTSLVSGVWCTPFGPADITKAFDVRFTITDSLGSTYAIETIVQSVVGFAIGLNNDRARFGGPVQKAGLQVDWDTEFNGVVDVTNRRCSATLSSAGWYRVMNFDDTNAGYQQGATGAEIVFHITRRRTNAGEETHEVKMLCLYNDVKFVDEVSATYPSYQRIDKIRYTYDSDGAHVDIHVNNTAPAVCVDFEVYCEPDRQSMYTAASLESVADAPAGETVLKTYEFVGNTEILRQTFTPVAGASYSFFGGCWYAKDGKHCHVHVGINGLTANTAAIVYTLPSSMIPPTWAVALGVSDFLSPARIIIYTSGEVEILTSATSALLDIDYYVE